MDGVSFFPYIKGVTLCSVLWWCRKKLQSPSNGGSAHGCWTVITLFRFPCRHSRLGHELKMAGHELKMASHIRCPLVILPTLSCRLLMTAM